MIQVPACSLSEIQESINLDKKMGDTNRVKSRYVTFDAHVHVMTQNRLSSGWRWVARVGSDYGHTSIGEAPTPETLTKSLVSAGLQGYFNFFFPILPSTSWNVNEWNDGFCSSQPMAIPLLSIHPEDTPLERKKLTEEFLINRNFAGLKIHSYIQNIRLDSTWLPDVCAALEEHNRILYVHTGLSHIYQSEYREEELADHIASILQTFPNLRVVAAHMFYPRIDIAYQLLEAYSNLYLDTAGVLTCLQQEGIVGEWVPSWEQHAHRMLFGSDFGFNPEPLADTIQQFENLPLSEKALRQIGGETAKRIVSSLGRVGAR